MTSISEVLSQLRSYGHRGAYSELTNYADELPLAVKQSPLVSLELSRAFLRQGRPIDAEAVLTAANLATATPGGHLILTLEKASLSIYRQMAIQAALQAAQAAFAAAEPQSIDPADRAGADRVHIRILLSAATYFETFKEQGQQARDRLPAIAKILPYSKYHCKVRDYLESQGNGSEYCPSLTSKVDIRLGYSEP
ncbi:MAG: hypothetical protein F6K00_01165 [Leptolyngbya sp. SIOISBB]|nr:hypothetical protein [Leptolyngbya sp. SIOISBB]